MFEGFELDDSDDEMKNGTVDPTSTSSQQKVNFNKNDQVRNLSSSSQESFHSCHEVPPSLTKQAVINGTTTESTEAAVQADALHIYDYYSDVEGNLYHKNDLTGKLIKEMNLVDAKYLFDKYVLKQNEPEINVPFTQTEDKLVEAGAKICNNDFEMVKNRLFRISSKTTEQIRNRFYMLTKE